jgi:hypothetical protein
MIKIDFILVSISSCDGQFLAEICHLNDVEDLAYYLFYRELVLVFRASF